MRRRGRTSTTLCMRLLMLATLVICLSQIAWKMHVLPAFCSSQALLGQSLLPSRSTWSSFSSSSHKSYRTLLHQSAQSTDPPNSLILSPSETQRVQRAFRAKALEAIALGNLAPGIELELIAALDLGTITWSQFPVAWRRRGRKGDGKATVCLGSMKVCFVLWCFCVWFESWSRCGIQSRTEFIVIFS